MNGRIVLLGAAGTELAEQIRTALTPVGAEVVIASREDETKTLGTLSGDPMLMSAPGYSGISQDALAEALYNAHVEVEESADGPIAMWTAPKIARQLRAPMLVFMKLSEEQLDAALKTLRDAGLSIPHKAVLTPYNAQWTPLFLYEELEKERAEIAAQKKN